VASPVPSKRSSAARAAQPSKKQVTDESDVTRDSLGYAIKSAQVRSYEILFQILGPKAISPARLTALGIVSKHPGINQSELAEQLRISRASVVKVVDTLEELGFVQRQAIADDRRSYALVATERGNKELTRMCQQLKVYEQTIAANLTVAERTKLMALLAKVAMG
jgi:DNA-binding MarR family transcriptional regulator